MAAEPHWVVTRAKVEKAIRKIVEVGRPRRIILFGSFVKGATTANSDLDVLVITGDTIADSRKESVRIRRALRGISMPIDILVVPQSKWDELRDVPGLVYREASTNGRVVYDSR